MAVDKSRWDAQFSEFGLEDDDLTLEDLISKMEKNEVRSESAPRGRARRADSNLTQFNTKYDPTVLAIMNKLCGKRGLDPRYETTSHFVRYAVSQLITQTMTEIREDKLATLWAGTAAEQDALDLMGQLQDSVEFVDSMKKYREQHRYDQDALDMVKPKVDEYILSKAPTDSIKRRLRAINWTADERD